jgi:large subunit ribosomal protein L25
MAKFVLKAEPRTEVGSRALIKLRKSGRLPGNIYGHKQANRLVSLDQKEMRQFIQAGHRILTVAVDGGEENGVLKEVQYDSLGTELIHVDIARVDVHEKISMSVRIETLGIPKGIAAGGNLDLPKREVVVEGPASAIPEKITVNIEGLELGQIMRIKDLKPIAECRYVDDPEGVVAAILLKKIEEAPTVAAAVPEMPEVIGKKKEEEGEAEEKEAEGKKTEGKKPEGKKPEGKK